jgi:hypothetical protein
MSLLDRTWLASLPRHGRIRSPIPWKPPSPARPRHSRRCRPCRKRCRDGWQQRQARAPSLSRLAISPQPPAPMRLGRTAPTRAGPMLRTGAASRKVLNVSQGGYFAWRSRPPLSAAAGRLGAARTCALGRPALERDLRQPAHDARAQGPGAGRWAAPGSRADAGERPQGAAAPPLQAHHRQPACLPGQATRFCCPTSDRTRRAGSRNRSRGRPAEVGRRRRPAERGPWAGADRGRGRSRQGSSGRRTLARSRRPGGPR